VADLPRLYDDLAWLWPALSPPQHYAAEAQLLDELIAERLGPGPQRVLELGAGGGHTLVHLSDRGHGRHHCVAADLSDPMLAHARRLIPGLSTYVGDMRDLRLHQAFDVVLIHDAIDYLLSPDDLRQTMDTVTRHLTPGGIACLAPTYTRETFIDGDTAEDAATTDTYDLTYFSYIHDPDPADDTFEMILLYLLRPPGSSGDADAEAGRPPAAAGRREVQLIEDRHTCGLFSRPQWLEAIRTAGLEAEFVQQGDDDDDGAWSLFVGTRPAASG
jgi:SAM-dependent methyltransferase